MSVASFSESFPFSSVFSAFVLSSASLPGFSTTTSSANAMYDGMTSVPVSRAAMRAVNNFFFFFMLITSLSKNSESAHTMRIGAFAAIRVDTIRDLIRFFLIYRRCTERALIRLRSCPAGDCPARRVHKKRNAKYPIPIINRAASCAKNESYRHFCV